MTEHVLDFVTGPLSHSQQSNDKQPFKILSQIHSFMLVTGQICQRMPADTFSFFATFLAIWNHPIA